MSANSDAAFEADLADDKEVLRALHEQIAAVRARVEEHREVMEAAGLASTARSETPETPSP